MNKLLMIILLTLTSCGNLIISSRGCYSDAIYSNEKSNLPFEKKIDVDVFFSNQEVKIKNLLDCKKIDELKITISKKYFYKYLLTINYSEINDDFKEEK